MACTLPSLEWNSLPRVEDYRAPSHFLSNEVKDEPRKMNFLLENSPVLLLLNQVFTILLGLYFAYFCSVFSLVTLFV